MQVGPRVAFKEINMMSDETSKLKMGAPILPSPTSPGDSSHSMLKYFLEVSIITVKTPNSKAECEKEKELLDLEGSSCNPTAESLSTWLLHLLLVNEPPQQ